MKNILSMLMALASGSAIAASTVALDAPLVEANRATFQNQFGGMSDNLSSWNKGAISFSEVFGTAFLGQDLKVVLLSKDFGNPNLGFEINNGYGVNGSMVKVEQGKSGYTGGEGYVSFSQGDSLSLMVYSQYLNQSFNLFDPNQDVFAWTEVMVDTWYYDTIDGQATLVKDQVKTLLFGFEDTRGGWDWDYNDVMFAVQALPSVQVSLRYEATTPPSGQPLPSVLASAIVGVGIASIYLRKTKK